MTYSDIRIRYEFIYLFMISFIFYIHKIIQMGNSFSIGCIHETIEYVIDIIVASLIFTSIYIVSMAACISRIAYNEFVSKYIH